MLSYIMKRDLERVEGQSDKAESALREMPTVEATRRKDALSEKRATLRLAANRSANAAESLRTSRETKKSEGEALDSLTDSVLNVIRRARKTALLPPEAWDGDVSAPETARFIIDRFKGAKDAGMIVESLVSSLASSEAASHAVKTAETEAFEAERDFYIALHEVDIELQNIRSYVKVNTPPKSRARRRLKPRKSKRKSESKAEADAQETPPTTEQTSEAD